LRDRWDQRAAPLLAHRPTRVQQVFLAAPHAALRRCGVPATRQAPSRPCRCRRACPSPLATSHGGPWRCKSRREGSRCVVLRAVASLSPRCDICAANGPKASRLRAWVRLPRPDRPVVARGQSPVVEFSSELCGSCAPFPRRRWNGELIPQPLLWLAGCPHHGCMIRCMHNQRRDT
jgi:hypothetical protein